MNSPTITRIGSTVDQLGECPLWDGRSGAFYWADCRMGLIRRLDLRSGERSDHEVPAPIGSFALNGNGEAIVALKDGFALYNFETRELRMLAQLGVDHPAVRLNDGVVDAQGRFVCGTMHVGRAPDEAPLGGLFRIDGNGRIEKLDDGIGVANGPCFSPDGANFYLADSAARVIWRYPVAADGALGVRSLFVDLKELGSAPDGAAVDTDGCLWSALVHRGAIARFTPEGKLDRMIELPTRHPTSLAFVGADLDMLFVTSIRDSGRIHDPSPEAGGLFAIEGLGVTGLPENRFASG